MEHKLYETGDKDAPDAIRDPNGEVCLALCRVCGGTEATLPTECPGRRLTEEEAGGISSGKLDFALGGKRLMFCSGSLDAVPKRVDGRGGIIDDIDFEQLKALSKELLTFADRMSEEPYFVVKPSILIVHKYEALIRKYELI